MMPASISVCFRSSKASRRASSEGYSVSGGYRNPSCSGDELESPDSMAVIARNTSSLTVLMMSSRSVCCCQRYSLWNSACYIPRVYTGSALSVVLCSLGAMSPCLRICVQHKKCYCRRRIKKRSCESGSRYAKPGGCKQSFEGTTKGLSLQSTNPNLIDWRLEHRSMKAHLHVHWCAQSWHDMHTCINVCDLGMDVMRHENAG